MRLEIAVFKIKAAETEIYGAPEQLDSHDIIMTS